MFQRTFPQCQISILGQKLLFKNVKTKNDFIQIRPELVRGDLLLSHTANRPPRSWSSSSKRQKLLQRTVRGTVSPRPRDQPIRAGGRTLEPPFTWSCWLNVLEQPGWWWTRRARSGAAHDGDICIMPLSFALGSLCPGRHEQRTVCAAGESSISLLLCFACVPS